MHMVRCAAGFYSALFQRSTPEEPSLFEETVKALKDAEAAAAEVLPSSAPLPTTAVAATEVADNLLTPRYCSRCRCSCHNFGAFPSLLDNLPTLDTVVAVTVVATTLVPSQACW